MPLLDEHFPEFAGRDVELVGREDVHIGFRAGPMDERMDVVVGFPRIGERGAPLLGAVVAADAVLQNDVVIQLRLERHGPARAVVVFNGA